MLYMVEMDFRNPAREADWHIWYLQHIAELIRTVPGFRAITPTPSPWLAMHDVVSAAVLQCAEYRANGGPAATGEWRAEHTNWYRNLFDGIDSTPEVAPDAHVLVSEGDAHVPGAGGCLGHAACECWSRPILTGPRHRHRSRWTPDRGIVRPCGCTHFQADLAADYWLASFARCKGALAIGPGWQCVGRHRAPARAPA
jgi:hypothetical protein